VRLNSTTLLLLIHFSRMLLRFILLKITTRPLMSPPIPERDIDPASLPTASAHTSPTLAPTSPLSSRPPTPDHLKNNHTPLQPNALMLTPPPPARSDTSVEDYLLPKALTTSSVKPSLLLMKPLSSPLEWLSEFLYIIRPWLYGECKRTGRLTCSRLSLSDYAKHQETQGQGSRGSFCHGACLS
jgi:peroxin-16